MAFPLLWWFVASNNGLPERKVPFDYAWRFQMVSQLDPPSCCAKDTNDSTWELVDLPHDYIITLPVAKNESSSGGYFPRKNAAYRKHFVLPEEWHGDRVSLYFEGVYKIAHIFLNGKNVSIPFPDSSHAYTGFEVRLDTEKSISYGASQPNVIAVYVDGSYGTEHWYTGAGLYRSVHLLHTSLPHLEPFSIQMPADIALVSGEVAEAAGATVKPALQVVNDALSATTIKVMVRVLDYDGTTIVGNACSSSVVLTLGAGEARTVHTLPAIALKAAALWSIQTPHLYLAQCTLTAAATGEVLDEVNATFGVRDTAWDADRGLVLNGGGVKIRGFCHHDDFTGY
jgi:beta-galactosidase/beta-glucuronidase